MHRRKVDILCADTINAFWASCLEVESISLGLDWSSHSGNRYCGQMKQNKKNIYKYFLCIFTIVVKMFLYSYYDLVGSMVA